MNGLRYRRQFRRCGKPNCRSCSDGPGHGPYWYAFWREEGKLKVRYLGKHAPVENPQPGVDGMLPPPSTEAPLSQPEPAPEAQPAAPPAKGLRIWLLGRFCLERNGVVVLDWRRHSAGTLLKRLLTAEHYKLPREVAARDLSPGASVEAAREVLVVALHALRRVLEPSLIAGEQSRYVVQEGDWLVVRLGPEDWVDLAAFEQLVGEVERAADPMPVLEAAMQLYQGDLLPDEQGLWCTAPREALRHRWHHQLLWASEMHAGKRQYDQAAESLTKLLTNEPVQEEAACRLMALLGGQGRPVEALQVYAALKDALRREVRTQPAPDIEAMAVAFRGDAPPHRHDPLCLATPPAAPSAPQPCSPFVGHAEEWDRIREVLTATRDGMPRTLLLAGEAGIGKTHLLEEGSLLATMLGFTVLRGTATEGEQGLPHALLAQLLAAPMHTRPPKALRRELRGAEALISVFPELGPALGITRPPPLDTVAAERLRLWTAVQTFLVALSESRPLVLVLDDLHWADEASLGVLAFFLRRRGKVRVAVLGTFPDENESDQSLPLIVHEGLRDHTLHVARLAGLAATEVGALARQQLGFALPPQQVEALHARSGGNPLFVTEFLKLSRDMSGVPSLDTEGFDTGLFQSPGGLLPKTVRQTLTRRLDRLEIGCRSLLRTAAVIGDRFTADLLARVASQTPDTCEDMLDAAIACGLVRERADVAGGYELVYGALRQALYEELLPGQRRRLHARVAAVLLEGVPSGREPNAEYVAYHLSHTRDQALAAEWLERAGDHASAVFAYRVASQHYCAARERLLALDNPDPDQDLARVRLEEKLSVLRLLHP